MSLGNRRVNPFTMPLSKPKPLPAEANPWFWNPNRFGVQSAPDHFLKKLKEMGEELAVTWNPINERWQLWARTNRVNQPICQGWRLLFIHNGPDGGYLPLDELVFARLYDASADKHGSGKAYFERIVQEMARDKERRDKQSTQDTIDLAMPSFEHAQIKVGYGPSNGSKFSTYHS